MQNNEKTLVFGASLKTERYSNIAIHRLRNHGFECIGLGLRPGKVLDVDIVTFDTPVSDIHTITMYMNPKRQADYMDQLLSYEPKRIIFNPGAENPILFNKAKALGIEVENACTLVLIGQGLY